MKSSLWDDRHQNEIHDKNCYAVIKELRLMNSSYTNQPISLKNRIKSLCSSQQLIQIHQKLRDIPAGSNTHRELKDLLQRKIPFELLLEYIGAPITDPVLETKSVIYNRLAKNHQRDNFQESFKDKVGYMLSFAAFAGSFTFGAATVATLFLPPNHPVSELARSMAEITPAAVKSFVPQGNMIYNNAKEISLALFAAIGLGSAYRQWSKGRKSAVEVHSKIAKPSNPMANAALGYDQHRNIIDTKLNHMSVSDQHLISHLSPYEMRAVLASSPQVAQELLDYLTPSFGQRKNSWASSQSFFSYMGHMMEGATLPHGMRKALTQICQHFSDSDLARHIGIEFQPSYESGQSLSQRLEKFRASSSSDEPTSATPRM